MRELLEFVLSICILFAIVLSLIAGLGVAAGKIACTQFGETVDYPVSYRWLAGCFVWIDSSWVPLDSYYKYIRIDR